jgi:hypothetical protein
MTGNYDYALWIVGIALISGGFLGLRLGRKLSENRSAIKIMGHSNRIIKKPEVKF